MEILAKKEDESSRQYVRRCLLYNIVNVEIKPGERIIEKEYCDLFQVSRTPIREAILDLHKNHLIDVMPKRGTFVSYIDEDRVEEVRQLRAVLEAEIAREACRKTSLSGNITLAASRCAKFLNWIRNFMDSSIRCAESPTGVKSSKRRHRISTGRLS